MNQKNDPLGYKKYINRILKQVEASNEIADENKKTIFLFQDTISREPARNNKVRSLGQQQKLLNDCYAIAVLLGTILFSSLVEKKENFLAIKDKVRRKEDWGTNTQNQRLMSLKQILKVCFPETTWLDTIPTGKVGHRKPIGYQLLTPEEMVRIIDVAGTPRNRAIFCLLREGLRPAELLRLNYESITFDEEGRAQIQIEYGKVGDGVVPTRRGAIFLRQWKDLHPFKEVGVALFPTASKGRICYQTLTKLNKNILEKAGIPKERSQKLYNWRKSSITNYLRTSHGRTREASVRYRTSNENLEKSYDLVSRDDINRSADEEAGIPSKPVQATLNQLPLDCARCHTENPSNRTECLACGWKLKETNPTWVLENKIKEMQEAQAKEEENRSKEMELLRRLLAKNLNPQNASIPNVAFKKYFEETV